jgi:hypothetical protein
MYIDFKTLNLVLTHIMLLGSGFSFRFKLLVYKKFFLVWNLSLFYLNYYNNLNKNDGNLILQNFKNLICCL